MELILKRMSSTGKMWGIYPNMAFLMGDDIPTMQWAWDFHNDVCFFRTLCKRMITASQVYSPWRWLIISRPRFSDFVLVLANVRRISINFGEKMLDPCFRIAWTEEIIDTWYMCMYNFRWPELCVLYILHIHDWYIYIDICCIYIYIYIYYHIICMCTHFHP